MSLKTPLKRARGLGSAREGVGHWWGQRLSALALVPLGCWFVYAVIGLAGNPDGLLPWLASPINASLTVVMLAALFHHSQLGIQVVIEDYVHEEWMKMTALILQKFLHAALGVAAIVAVLKIAVGG